MDRNEWADRFATAMLRLGAGSNRDALFRYGCELWKTDFYVTPEHLAYVEVENLAPGDTVAAWREYVP